MSNPEHAEDGEDILKSIRRLVSVEEEDLFRSDRPEGAPGDRLVLTGDMSTDRKDVPPLVLGGETAAAAPPEPAAVATFDEAALRALVAEIVRDELSGALGERATSNIRKLVRREIRRAQSLRDTD